MEVADITGAEAAGAAVALQRAVWSGADVAVPTGQLLAAAHAGGTVLGAWAGDQLVGFCYGFVGLDPEPSPHPAPPAPAVAGGAPVMWSHMLAVLPSWRGRGIGRTLKLAQAERTRALGLDRIRWTFDPLEARNAHLNLVALGAVAARYHPDRYGPLDDALNRGLPTDRLIADWYVGPHADDGAQVEHGAPLLVNPGAPHGAPVPAEVVAAHQGLLELAVPPDDWRADPEVALAWRHNVRHAFTTAFAEGWRAVGITVTGSTARYRLVRDALSRDGSA